MDKDIYPIKREMMMMKRSNHFNRNSGSIVHAGGGRNISMGKDMTYRIFLSVYIIFLHASMVSFLRSYPHESCR
jgi:hypothetical protein